MRYRKERQTYYTGWKWDGQKEGGDVMSILSVFSDDDDNDCRSLLIASGIYKYRVHVNFRGF